MTICNCNQGRLPCTCLSIEQVKMQNDYDDAVRKREIDLYAATAQLINNRPGMRVGDEPSESRFEELLEVGSVTHEYAADVAVRRGRQLETAWAEIRSLGVRVQVLQGLAVIGWAAAILLALGV